MDTNPDDIIAEWSSPHGQVYMPYGEPYVSSTNEGWGWLHIHDKPGYSEPYGLDAIGKVVQAPGSTKPVYNADGNPAGYIYTGTFYGTNTPDELVWVNLMVRVKLDGRVATSYPVAGNYINSYPTQVPYWVNEYGWTYGPYST